MTSSRRPHPSHDGSITPDRLVTALAGRYVVERELGRGGMATVYLARDVRHARKVAVKVLRPELAAAAGIGRFLHEIHTIASLQHPHILGLIDSGELDGGAYYVMPYVDGELLRDRLVRDKQLPIAEAVRIACEVASALDCAHRRGVVHRDVKPENILLHDGQALVADFGIALAIAGGGETRITGTGFSLGTPQYISPEQAIGDRNITARSDVVRAGCGRLRNAGWRAAVYRTDGAGDCRAGDLESARAGECAPRYGARGDRDRRAERARARAPDERLLGDRYEELSVLTDTGADHFDLLDAPRAERHLDELVSRLN